MTIAGNLLAVKQHLPAGVKLVVVSKGQSAERIQEAYAEGQRIFGENKAQELIQKQKLLPKDIQWHFIGHLQTNKIKQIAPFISLIHAVDSLKLLIEINKQAICNQRIIDCLLQAYIADEETKFGLTFDEVIQLLRSKAYGSLKNIRIRGLMGMASHTVNKKQIKEEFHELKTFFNGVKHSFFNDKEEFNELSMGMSLDYPIALEQGSTMVRIGSKVFGHEPMK